MTIDYPAAYQIPALKALWQEAFGDDDAYLDAFFETAFSPTRCRAVTEMGQVAAALYWLDCQCSGQKFAYLYAVATGKPFRNRGICRALMADTHARLTAAGYAGAILVPGMPSLRTFYAGMGYLPGGRFSRLQCGPGNQAISLRPISPDEYGKRRKQFLPENCIHPGKEAMAFLARVSGLYDGGSFLLAAHVEDGVLHGEELLGSTACAADIITALGADSGEFCIPGDALPFSMYYPLTSQCPVPGWLGIAFNE